MAASHLIAVPTSSPSAPTHNAADISHRIRLLQQEARSLAREEIDQLAGDMAIIAERAGEVAATGEAFPPGIRELATRIEEDIDRHVKVLRAIMERSMLDRSSQG